LSINWNRLEYNYSVNQSYCYILIVPAFGIISTTMSANSNKSIFGYIGMVKSRPALTNNCPLAHPRWAKGVNNLQTFTKSSLHGRRFLSSKPSGFNNILLHPSFVTGLVDGEGSFAVNVRKNPKSRLGWSVEPTFRIRLHLKDEELLKFIQAFFGIGLIHKGLDYVNFNVGSLKEISNIISHFDKYPLITNKQADYLLFREVIMMMLNKEHLTSEGLDKIIAIRASLNWGLSEELKVAFPNTVLVKRPLINSQLILDPQWVSGFTAGDGGFSIYVRSAKDYVLGEKVYCRFHIAQHSKDLELMQLLITPRNSTR
jgi:hypothetical protein